MLSGMERRDRLFPSTRSLNYSLVSVRENPVRTKLICVIGLSFGIWISFNIVCDILLLTRLLYCPRKSGNHIEILVKHNLPGNRVKLYRIQY